MDGNGRWAQQRGMPRLAGHRAGTDNLRRIIEECVRLGIKYLTIYAFSTENWRRPPEEVSGLMALLENVLERELRALHENGVQIRHLGRCEGVNKRLVRKIKHAVEKIYNVKVREVRTANRKGKPRRARFKRGLTSHWKKAVVVLDSDHHIDLF